jgi:hypothetical protein
VRSNETRNETRPDTPVRERWRGLAFCLVRVAVAEGFEPSEAFTSHAFEACSLGRSDTPPPGRVPKSAGRARIQTEVPPPNGLDRPPTSVVN